MNARPLSVTTVADARAGLSGVLRGFRANPGGAEVVVLGSHRRAEAVLLPYARFEQILATAEALAAEADNSLSRQGTDEPAEATQGSTEALGAQHPERGEQIERWLRSLDATLATADEIVERGRHAFHEDAALPLACEALAARVGELSRLLVAADPVRFEDPMWSLAARGQEIVVHRLGRVDEQLMWVTVTEGFPEIADLVERQRELQLDRYDDDDDDDNERVERVTPLS